MSEGEEEPMEADAEPMEAEPVLPEAGEAVSAASTGTAATAALSDRDGQRLISTQTVQHEYLTLNGKVARDTITVDGTVTTVMDFIYDESGQPFALKYSDDGGKSFDTYYYVLNLQGDVVKLVWYIPGFEYEAVATYTYDAWGNILSATGELAEINPLRYRGYYYDTETGFYYLQSRYYDPATRRFINADGYASTGQGFVGCNMFAYCLNSPIVMIDSSGNRAHQPNELFAMMEHDEVYARGWSGNVFVSADDAALAAGTDLNLRTAETNLEHWCGVYKFTIYSSTIYYLGDVHSAYHSSVDPNDIDAEALAVEGEFDTPVQAGTLFAVVHSHPHCICHNPNEFSDGDRRYVEKNSCPLYLAAPTGTLTLLFLNGANNLEIRTVSNGLPVNNEDPFEFGW